MLIWIIFMVLCTARWGDPHVLECEGRTLVVSRALGSSEGGDSSARDMHTLEDVEEERGEKGQDNKQVCSYNLTFYSDLPPQQEMPSDKNDSDKNVSPAASVDMKTPIQGSSTLGSSLKKSNMKSRRGDGSLRKVPEEAGVLDAEGVMVVGKLLAQLGF
jgi:hypothetical protein